MPHKIEQKWVDYWEELYELIKNSNEPKLVNQNHETISLEDAQQLIQDEVYKGNDIEFKVSDETIHLTSIKAKKK